MVEFIAAIDWRSWLGLIIGVGSALVAALIVIAVLAKIMKASARRHEWAKVLATGVRHPARILIAALFLWAAITATLPEPGLRNSVNHVFLVVSIALGSWLVSGLVSFSITLSMARYRTEAMKNNNNARKMKTQLAIVRRLAVAVIWIIGIGAILLTFPGVQAVGTSLLASAGLVSLVAGLAAQSTLANVFAGVQLAFSGAIRVDDVVIAEGEWGRIEEITLTYVVVHLWDDRRMVLPSTHFTTTPFQNWTRSSSELFGAIELDLDWRVSPTAMRQHLAVILAQTDNWDGRASILQVTSAVGGTVRIRILVTAVDSANLFDLRCYVREEMVEWIHRKDPAGMPRTRVQMVEEQPRLRTRATEREHTDTVGLFTGTPDAEQRAHVFTAAIPTITAERARAERAARGPVPDGPQLEESAVDGPGAAGPVVSEPSEE